MFLLPSDGQHRSHRNVLLVLILLFGTSAMWVRKAPAAPDERNDPWSSVASDADCRTVREWVRHHRDDLPTTHPSFSSYPMQ